MFGADGIRTHDLLRAREALFQLSHCPKRADYKRNRAFRQGITLQVELLAITPDAERLIETAGRTCYDSTDRAGADSAPRFIQMLIQRGHHSVLEHASATFAIRGVSRALTHQLVRHRLASYSQRSQRYVKEDGFDVVTPPSIAARPQAAARFQEYLRVARETYDALRSAGVPAEDARFVLPNACRSDIVVTANFREWRHILALRGAPQAQWEIRQLAVAVLRELKNRAPAVFSDFSIDEVNNVITTKASGG